MFFFDVVRILNPYEILSSYGSWHQIQWHWTKVRPSIKTATKHNLIYLHIKNELKLQ